MKTIMSFAFCILLLLSSCGTKEGKERDKLDKRDKSEMKDTSKIQHDTILSGGENPDNNRKINRTQPGPAQNYKRARNNKGIGPISEVVLLDKIDDKMVEEGKVLFSNNCLSCHLIHEATTGPALGNVLQRRSPEFVMNMILNTREMIQKDPTIMALRGQYESEMVQVDVTQEEARKIVEYLRTNQ